SKGKPYAFEPAPANFIPAARLARYPLPLGAASRLLASRLLDGPVRWTNRLGRRILEVHRKYSFVLILRPRWAAGFHS
ncbi:MAG: hypothetical protein VCF07_16310, partial [Nitrospinota bacterium]